VNPQDDPNELEEYDDLSLEALDEDEAALLAETSGTAARRLLSRRLLQRRLRRVKIDVYDGYGTAEQLTVTGRIYFDRRLRQAQEQDSRLRNLVNTSRHFMTNDAPQVWVEICLGEYKQEVCTDPFGLFSARFENLQALPHGMHAIQVSLSMQNQRRIQAETGVGHFMLHDLHSDRVGIISDIDDTILLTGATRKMHMLKNIFLSNHLTQAVVPGMSELYRAIHYGPQGDGYDATHYVSSSPAHLYTRIKHFLRHQQFPEGSIDLKKVRLRKKGQITDSLFDHEKYKFERIRRILETFPRRRYVLFGDSGEHDSEIYRRIAMQYPSRILGVYIHNVSEADPYHPRFEGQMLFSGLDKVRRDLLHKGLIAPPASHA
jgi:phosphatidate phosphatase APP1